MTVYVDAQVAWGWVIRGREVESCHMFTDEVDLNGLHAFALKIGLQRRWFQDKKKKNGIWHLACTPRENCSLEGRIEKSTKRFVLRKTG